VRLLELALALSRSFGRFAQHFVHPRHLAGRCLLHTVPLLREVALELLQPEAFGLERLDRRLGVHDPMIRPSNPVLLLIRYS
jgi:hypothetical protein